MLADVFRDRFRFDHVLLSFVDALRIHECDVTPAAAIRERGKSTVVVPVVGKGDEIFVAAAVVERHRR